MKKLLCALMALMLAWGVTAALAEYCEHGYEDSPCDITWQYDSVERMHRRICLNHVEDKEDPFSYMPLTEWEDCTLDEGGECTVCGHDYVRDDTGEDTDIPDSEMDLMMLEMYLWYCEENGVPPVTASAAGAKLTLSLDDAFIEEYLYAMGVEVSESMYAKTTATLTLTEGTSYPATGEAIEPELDLVMSEYGPGTWMGYYEVLVIDDVSFENNTEPGTATVNMTVQLVPGDSYTLTTNFTIEGAVFGTYCKYGSADSPCDIIWYVDGDAQKHCRACRNHIEDKEDMSSYVQLTDWEDCTVDEETGECSVCGADYVNEPNDENYAMYMLEFYMMKSAENGTAPVIVTISGNTMSVEFTEDYLTFLDEYGLSYPSEMRSATVYTITTTGGDSFAYTGEEVKPNVTIDSTGKGPGAWMQEYGMLSFGDITYANNVNVGNATASVEVSVREGETYAFAATFTIGDGASDRLPGDATGNDTIDVTDVIAILLYAAGQISDIDLSNADVNADGKVDLHDALRILQYDAGWDVTLE